MDKKAVCYCFRGLLLLQMRKVRSKRRCWSTHVYKVLQNQGLAKDSSGMLIRAWVRGNEDLAVHIESFLYYRPVRPFMPTARHGIDFSHKLSVCLLMYKCNDKDSLLCIFGKDRLEHMRDKFRDVVHLMIKFPDWTIMGAYGMVTQISRRDSNTVYSTMDQPSFE